MSVSETYPEKNLNLSWLVLNLKTYFETYSDLTFD